MGEPTTSPLQQTVSARQAFGGVALIALMACGWFGIQANAERDSASRMVELQSQAEARAVASLERTRERFALDYRTPYIDGAIAAGDGKRTLVLVSYGCDRALVDGALADRRFVMRLQDMKFASVGCSTPGSATCVNVLPLPAN